MKFCPVDRAVNPDDAPRCRSCGHVFKKGRKDPPAPTLSRMPKSRSRASVEAAAPAVRRIGAPPRALPALLLLGADGQIVETFRLGAEPVVVGRTEGPITFPDDPLLSPAHASLRCDGVQAFVRDLKSRHGTFVRAERVPLFDGLECLLGDTLLRWTPAAGETWRAAVVSADGVARSVAVAAGATLGRKGQDLELDDPAVSPLHARVKDGALVDARSLNGLFYRIPAQRNEVLEAGAEIRLGRQLFRFDAPAEGGRRA